MSTSPPLSKKGAAAVSQAEGISLPGGLRVTADGLPGGVIWTLRNKHGTPQEELNALRPVLLRNGFNVQAEEMALTNLRMCGEQQRRMLYYAGSIIAGLYQLDSMFVVKKLTSEQLKLVNRAACASHILIRYWKERDAGGDDWGAFALPMLWRSYWYALTILKRVEHPPNGWQDLLDEEYARATRNWQQICVDNEHVWFFESWLLSQLQNTNYSWQQLREQEVEKLVAEELHQLRGMDLILSSRAQQYLLTLIAEWYLPHYNIRRAKHLRKMLYQMDGSSLRPVLKVVPLSSKVERAITTKLEQFVAWLKVIPLGIARLWAGIGVGYSVTAFQGDIWRTLYALSEGPEFRWWVLLILLAGGSFLYLVHGIYRRAGLQAGQRAWAIFWRGEVVSLIGGLASLLLLGQLLLKQDQKLNWSISFFMVVLYAQLALFIGIFTQLLFDAKPATAPLDAP